jgi:hypothetical protein
VPGKYKLVEMPPNRHHQALINVDAFDRAILVPAFGPGMECTS